MTSNAFTKSTKAAPARVKYVKTKLGNHYSLKTYEGANDQANWLELKPTMGEKYLRIMKKIRINIQMYQQPTIIHLKCILKL